MNFQKTALFVFSKCIVLAASHGFVLIVIATFPHFQEEKEVIRKYEAWYCTRLDRVMLYNIPF